MKEGNQIANECVKKLAVEYFLTFEGWRCSRRRKNIRVWVFFANYIILNVQSVAYPRVSPTFTILIRPRRWSIALWGKQCEKKTIFML